MILNVWDTLKEYFMKIYNNPIGNKVVYLLLGTIIGIILGLIVYYLFLNFTDHKNERINKKPLLTKAEAKEKAIVVNNLIMDMQRQSFNDTEELNIIDKAKYLFTKSSVDLAREIAAVYYPKTYELCKDDEKLKNDVFYEISVDDLINLIYHIHDQLDKYINGNFITKNAFKLVKIKTVVKQIEKKKMKDLKIEPDEPKKQGLLSKTFSNLSNKLVDKFKDLSVNFPKYKEISNKVLEIVGVEVAKVYSKNTYRDSMKGLTSSNGIDVVSVE